LISIIKWQNETELNYEDGLIMTYTERIRHKTRMFEIGKDCIIKLISSPQEIEKVSGYIDKKCTSTSLDCLSQTNLINVGHINY
jgi:hypothetical protein